MQRRLSAAGTDASNHYRIVTDVPVIGGTSLRLAICGPAIAVRGTGANATGRVWQDYRCNWATTYDIRRFNDELVVRVCYRP